MSGAVWRAARTAMLLFAGLAAVGVGCSGAKNGQRGESCKASGDCAKGLACVNLVCGVSQFELKPTGNECVRIECRTTEDCCQLDSFCEQLQEDCANGDQLSCDQFDASCNCGVACIEEECVNICEEDFDCANGTCVGGRCVGCETDDDCFGDDQCVDNECEEGCTEDIDCPFFHQCQNAICVEVGCMTDRECVAFTGKSRAFCEDTECKVPCKSDLECGDPESFNFMACVKDLCVDVGCETDTECRLKLNITPGNRDDAECRPAAR